MAKLKDPSQRLKTNRYNELIDKHEAIINEARRKQIKYKDDAKRCERYEKQIEHAKRMEEYYWFKQNDPVSICTDYEIASSVNTDMVEFHLKNLFQDDNPYVSIMLNDGKVKRRMLDAKTLRTKAPHLLSLNMNSYLSNVDYAHQRTIKDKDGTEEVLKGAYKELVVKTYAITIDLDYRNSVYAGTAAEDLYEVMKDNGAFNDIGEPSYCVVSSDYSGMQLIYLLDEPYKTYYDYKRITQFENTIKNMVEIFKDYASDPACTDIGHLFRLPCSYNSKTGTYSFVLHWDMLRDDDYEVVRYPFEELEKRAKKALGLPVEPAQPVEPVVTKAPPAPKPKRATREPKTAQTDTVRPNNLKALAINRCRDLKILAELRKGQAEGTRHTLLLIYATQFIRLCNDIEILSKELHSVNNTFDIPLVEAEIENIIDTSNKKHYKYSDKTICDLLTLTPFEISRLQTIGHNMTKDENNAKQRLRYQERSLKQGRMTKELRDNRSEEAKNLYHQGWSKEQIAEKYGISTRTVYRILTRPIKVLNF